MPEFASVLHGRLGLGVIPTKPSLLSSSSHVPGLPHLSTSRLNPSAPAEAARITDTTIAQALFVAFRRRGLPSSPLLPGIPFSSEWDCSIALKPRVPALWLEVAGVEEAD